MTSKEVIEAMVKGETLCMEFDKEHGKVFWLEPTRRLVRQDVGENVTAMNLVKPGGDRLFKDASSQTWTVA